MTEENRKLLLKDLSARLPYGVKIALKNNGSYHHDNVAKKGDITIDRLKGFTGSYFSIYHDNPLDWDWYDDDIDIEDIKPYLFPLSSMNEEKRKEFLNIQSEERKILFDALVKYRYEKENKIPIIPSQKHIDWLNANHFDYRGLIEKGLAIDATNKNIYEL